MKPHTIRSYEYKNDFLYIVIRQVPETGPQAYLYCCGINISKFDPICWGKAGICSNPAFKGLQLLRADVSAQCLKKKVRPRQVEGHTCSPMTPRGDGWYRDNLLIDQASPRDIREILEFSVTDLVETVLRVCAPEVRLPKTLLNPPAMQKWLESLSVKKP